MKYYSETLNKVFENEKDCLNAEKEYKAKVEEEEKRKKELADSRKIRAKEVEDAYHASIAAQKNSLELRDKFVRDYGSWHMTISSPEGCSLFDTLFNIL